MSSRNSFASCAARVLLWASTSVGRCTASISHAVVADLPVPVAPSSTTSVSPALMRAASSAIACGWSPLGLVFADDLEGAHGTCGLHLSSVGGATDTGAVVRERADAGRPGVSGRASVSRRPPSNPPPPNPARRSRRRSRRRRTRRRRSRRRRRRRRRRAVDPARRDRRSHRPRRAVSARSSEPAP